MVTFCIFHLSSYCNMSFNHTNPHVTLKDLLRQLRKSEVMKEKVKVRAIRRRGGRGVADFVIVHLYIMTA